MTESGGLEVDRDLTDFLNPDSLKKPETLVEDIVHIFKKYSNEFFSNHFDNHEKSIHLLKTFVELYESLLSKSFGSESELLFEPIFKIIHNILLNKITFDLSFNAEQSLLKIISCMCQICFSHTSENNLLALAKFYVLNMEYIAIHYNTENCDAKNISFRLDILRVIYPKNADLSENNNAIKLIEFIKDIKTKTNVDEKKLLSNIILFGNENLLKKSLLFIVEKFLKCSDEILLAFWQDILLLLSDKSETVQLQRILLILCNLFSLSFYENLSVKNTELIKLMFEDKHYWKLIQVGLSKKNVKKLAMYLFKNTIDFLLKTNQSINCIEYDDSESLMPLCIWWNSNMKDEISHLYKKIIIILEYLDEQQLHIILPIFSMIEEVVIEILAELNSGLNVDISWVLLIYEKILLHESTQVVKWGLDGLLNLPDNFYLNEKATEASVFLLVTSLNNINLYYNEGINITKILAQFFKKFTDRKTSKPFFRFLILNICNSTWSPEALFFVVHALTQIPAQKILQKEEISKINLFVTKIFKTQNKTIRLGIQHELLKTIMLLTDTKNTTLKSLMSLLSSFLTLGSLKRGNVIWNHYSHWIKSEYPVEEAKTSLESFNYEQMGKTEEKYLALMFMLYTDTYESDKQASNAEHDSVNFSPSILYRYLLLKFKNIDKRPYCNKVLLNKILILICIILEESLNYPKRDKCLLLKTFFDFYTDILLYIKTEVWQSDKLQQFELISLYVRAFDVLLRSSSLHRTSGLKIAIDEICLKISEEFSIFEKSVDNISPVRFYCCMQFLRVIISNEYYNCEIINGEAVYFYLRKFVNDSLPRGPKYFEDTVNSLTIWGKVNSEFLECKWKIMEYLVNNGVISKIYEPLDHEIFLTLCSEGLQVGGYGVLFPIMSILKNLLPKCQQSKKKEIIDFCWKLIIETKKSDSFRKLMKKFVEMLFHDALLAKEEQGDVIHLMYTNLIFSDSSLGVVNTFMKHVQSLNIKRNLNSLFCEILSISLIFGPILRKDERLILEICTIIESQGLCQIRNYDTSNEIRGRALEMISSLNQSDSKHRKFVQKVIGKLLKTDEDLNKKKARYFQDSQVHRIKHRLMQALLLVEPLLKSCQETAKTLSDWLYNALLFQNSQPSVKYQQQWLLIRILIGNLELLNEFWSRVNHVMANDAKTKGICSLIIISYHLYKLLPRDKISTWINEAVTFLLPLCMDQQFEIRLHSQVILKKFYESAVNMNLEDVLIKFKVINDCILKSLMRSRKTNGLKNAEKLEQDFYLNIFHPLNDYSLQTIFVDLPRLSNVGSDEWISLDVFERCGFRHGGLNICPYNSLDSLKKIECAKWSVYDPILPKETFEEDTINNYQKKIIPIKSSGHEFFDDVDSFSCQNCQFDGNAKGGLIVVATLIDRIPNLGGLARTCEVFGAFEYILGSLKYIEDKQFASLSVTAEKWVTVKEIKKQNLLEYLIDMKKNGYAIIGAEQTLHSETLSNFKFPHKSLLLLGNEKEGIPPNLLPLLDVCVEIPQVGIIRSLNVHVTGALFIWEYAKQNRFLKDV